jgi:Fe-S cluster biogenesis protein NfuA
MPDTKEALRTMLRDVLGPLLASDGGELYLVSVEKKEIRMHLAGTLSGSPALEVVVRRIVEPAVKAVSPKAKLIVSSGFRIPQGAEKF